MTTDTKPCAGCPWTSKAARDRAALTDEVRAAAVEGKWFCCHVHMGTCYGAERYGKAKRQQALHK